MALVLSGSIDISGSMTATTILISSPGAAGMVSSSAQITELAPLMAYTASLKGAAIVSSSQQITNYYKFAETASANTFYGTQTISGSLNIGNANTLNIYRTDNTRALQLYTTNDECVINSWEASSEPLHIRSMGSGGRIQFFTSGSEKMRLTPDGYQRMATDTKGIQFNGDTAAANALNDYEEGTWTPTYIGTNLTVVTYGNAFGWYTKVGRLVTVTICIMTDDITVIGSENLRIGGLPFTSNSSAQATNALIIGDSSRWSSNPPKYGVLNGNSTEIFLYRDSGATGSGTDPVTVKTDDMADASGNRNMVRGTLTYFV